MKKHHRGKRLNGQERKDSQKKGRRGPVHLSRACARAIRTACSEAELTDTPLVLTLVGRHTSTGTWVKSSTKHPSKNVVGQVNYPPESLRQPHQPYDELQAADGVVPPEFAIVQISHEGLDRQACCFSIANGDLEFRELVIQGPIRVRKPQESRGSRTGGAHG